MYIFVSILSVALITHRSSFTEHINHAMWHGATHCIDWLWQQIVVARRRRQFQFPVSWRQTELPPCRPASDTSLSLSLYLSLSLSLHRQGLPTVLYFRLFTVNCGSAAVNRMLRLET